ncbi:MAG TPA: ASCH domain-containing protein [Candidatus Nealsonbacteria bacterium]|uniref:ASCH domain-containing protein n=1 Tax=marine sediment metagenome TaxID=412755 RepID=A0A0F9XT40_9ZZZZ|nr:ASCH domain-containing protein [Candidatus Nealsonbacteria bacterium]HEB46687.1 ASCH domain-containing protein [Candidatus Nealsonbacteria bacterium]
MNGLTMSQPWAELLVSGKKKIEVRTKNTNHRGWFYIYVAKKDTKENVIKKFGFRSLHPTVLKIYKEC